MSDACHSGAGTVVCFLVFFTRLTSQLDHVPLTSYVSFMEKERWKHPHCCSHNLLPRDQQIVYLSKTIFFLNLKIYLLEKR